jgi:hypothetical protein
VWAAWVLSLSQLRRVAVRTEAARRVFHVGRAGAHDTSP